MIPTTTKKGRPSQADLDANLDRLEAEAKEDFKRAEELMKRDPKLPLISAYVIARDLRSADRSMEWLREGKYDWKTAEVFTGSYGRMDLRVRAHAEGLITNEQVLDGLTHAWSGSDPDDTDPRFLALWRDAWVANGRKPLRDGKGLPRDQWLHVYRGQDEVTTVGRTPLDPSAFGIAWSLDPMVAKKFANGAATREHSRGGVVYVARVHRSDVMGYMVGRNEAEVIVDPTMLHDVEVWR